ncbi:hypothetical protein J8I26_03825 [Herbaspirillum sp. LeCh32-8]|uniref:hypothetical protein n=1 Tax=Herbaspirillum sp. LeCh32-8 TaxID=2821356 RepID=UPI001AE16477|nr:hypothetical protein [Herbaspirillum sp. LeCh32-8]MBP0597217.1 hypothetical protein [Herbaspirillum sp. LeCh32-8]
MALLTCLDVLFVRAALGAVLLPALGGLLLMLLVLVALLPGLNVLLVAATALRLILVRHEASLLGQFSKEDIRRNV